MSNHLIPTPTLPCCAWAQKREAGCSQTGERAFSGDRKVFRRVCERRSPGTLWWDRNRCAVGFPQYTKGKKRKAERAPLPGATGVG
jgi:hypothetical protein